MLGTFLGLQTSLRGLMADQAVIETVAHNIDNANTPGYSRQRVNLTAATALEVPGLRSAAPGQIGTGVQIQQITRLRDSYLDEQYRQQNTYLGEWTAEQGTLDKISAIINEPSDTGLSSVMQQFWNDWSKLGSNPSDLATRTLVLQDGQTVAQTLNQMAQQFQDLNSDLSASLTANVAQANQDLVRIAQLNRQITSVYNVGEEPNDLLDQRDLLVDQLSNLADVSIDNANGHYTVTIGGQVVVKDDEVLNVFSVNGVAPGTDGLEQTTSPNTVDVSTITGGQIAGIQKSMVLTNQYKSELDGFASGLANGPMTIQLAGDWTLPQSGNLPVPVTMPDGTSYKAGVPVSSLTLNGQPLSTETLSDGTVMAVIPQGTSVTVNGLNGLLALGYSPTGTGVPFFTAAGGGSIMAANIQVGLDVNQIAVGLTVDPSSTGASLTAKAGDGTLAITISTMKDATMTFDDFTAGGTGSSQGAATMNGTLSEFLQSVVSGLGIQSQTADQQVSNQQSLVSQIDQQRQSVSGVSIDEELTNMIQYQQAYSASARMISTINQMLDTIINLGR
ncbi:MAG: flagellar hook-associated protein FlgK [Alicyclobacillus herbarius]|uniref:flagellar hook-associated protein FlgK n=1 Tax=Alicyclobacillus herbarius TaxID=122960 RepID=UPI002354DD28|nr:flagellar hook-associated protein FlgK [Alicyclobacillus herbarius]MCL6632370.1 flagellar hook-associated protein FlgK [Alicyclobacillus herbarius]